MATSSDQPVSLPVTDSERYELYDMLDVRGKLESGQAYIEEARVMSGPPRGNFPPRTCSRMVRIKLAVNDWVLCYAHQYVSASGTAVTRPDPKWIRVDDVIFK